LLSAAGKERLTSRPLSSGTGEQGLMGKKTWRPCLHAFILIAAGIADSLERLGQAGMSDKV